MMTLTLQIAVRKLVDMPDLQPLPVGKTHQAMVAMVKVMGPRI
jgi:hypothetical protein